MEQGSWNFERMQNLGFAYIMAPAIKRLYPDPSQRKAAMKRHLQFFNTSPIMQSLITGVVLSMEEDRANGADISDDTINAVKTAMMGQWVALAIQSGWEPFGRCCRLLLPVWY